MKAISLEVSGDTARKELIRGMIMPPGRQLGAYLTEAKYEMARMLRTPAFAIPFLGLPALLYLLFGALIFSDAIRNDLQAGKFIFTAFAVFGVMGPGLFGFGMTVAMEREQGLLKLKRALPMPAAAYPIAKMFMAIMFALIVMATMIAALPLGHLKLTVGRALAVMVINVLGALPFCAIGLFIGARTTSRSAAAFVNIIYQVMMHISGLFYPLPGFLRAIAPVWPTYHLQQLAFSAIGAPSQGKAVIHVIALTGVTATLTALSVRRLAREG
jgi:ABC-2 type transport system permease protein